MRLTKGVPIHILGAYPRTSKRGQYQGILHGCKRTQGAKHDDDGAAKTYQFQREGQIR